MYYFYPQKMYVKEKLCGILQKIIITFVPGKHRNNANTHCDIATLKRLFPTTPPSVYDRQSYVTDVADYKTFTCVTCSETECQ